MRGIIMAGGRGTRMYPLTNSISKQLIPVYDKPMIYYPLATLMSAGIREVAIVSTPEDLPAYIRLLGDGSRFGVQIEYFSQPEPKGIAQAFLLTEKFIKEDTVCLVLGDNVFHGLSDEIPSSASKLNSHQQAHIFGYNVSDPERYGVVYLDKKGNVKGLLEKPTKPKSNLAVVGLYIYSKGVVDKVKTLTPSLRGELEITDLNKLYLQEDKLAYSSLGPGVAWLDTGTYDSLMDASTYVRAVENRQGIKIACLEEIGFNKGWLSLSDLEELVSKMGNTSYRNYLERIIWN